MGRARSGALAIYWDWENIHWSLLHESGPAEKQRYTVQDPIINVDPVVDYAHSKGIIAIHRAYGNWNYMQKYANMLSDHAIELVQIFGRFGKNGADIRLSLDALEDFGRHKQITHVLVVGGDSDYIGLAQKARRYGLTVLGIGTQASSAAGWVAACDEFRIYQTLVRGSDPMADVGDLQEARELVRAAFNMRTEHTSPWMTLAELKTLMLRRDPTFDEATFEYSQFSKFVAAQDDLLAVKELQDGVLGAALRDEAGAAPPAAKVTLRRRIEMVLRRRASLRMPTDRSVLWKVVAALPSLARRSPYRDAAAFDVSAGDLLGLKQVANDSHGDADALTPVRKSRSICLRLEILSYCGEESSGIHVLIDDRDRIAARMADGLAHILCETGSDIVAEFTPEQLARALLGHEAGDAALEIAARAFEDCST